MSDDSDGSPQVAPVAPEPERRSLREVLRAKLAEPSRTVAPLPAREEAAPTDVSRDVSEPSPATGLAGRLAAVLAASPGDERTTEAMEPPAPVSVLRFDANHPEVRAFSARQGWARPDRKVGILKAELTFTTDGWTTTGHAPLQALAAGESGFRLEGVVPGTALELAIHAELGLSVTGAPPFEAQLDTWFNNGGANYRTPAEEP